MKVLTLVCMIVLFMAGSVYAGKKAADTGSRTQAIRTHW